MSVQYGAAGAFAQEYTVMRNTLSDNKLALTQHSCHQPQTHRRPGRRLARTTRVAERWHGDSDAWAEP